LKSILLISVTAFTLLVTGCQSTKKPSAKDPLVYLANESLFESRLVAVERPQDIFVLTQTQQQDFLSYYDKWRAKGKESNYIVFQYLNRIADNFSFLGETYNATKAMEHRSGNCLSLALLTTALAKLVDLDVGYRMVHTAPVFEKHRNIVLSSAHVQTIIFDEGFVEEPGEFYIYKPGLVIDYFPSNSNISGRYISENQFLAMYYQNMSASALLDNDLYSAYWNIKQAAELDSESENTQNTLAVIHRRIGDSQTAEKIYQQLVNNKRETVSVLENYELLLRLDGRLEEAKSVEDRIAKLNDPNPYNWLEAAYIAKNEGSNDKAILYLEKVIEKAPYVLEAYKLLSAIYKEQGKGRKAKATLKSSLKWAFDTDEKKQIKYKLYGYTQKSTTDHRHLRE